MPARLHVVTGKGGTGKTTVAVALALALASSGRRVLLAEVEGRQGVSQTLGVPPLGPAEQLVMKVGGGGEIWGVSVDPSAALVEYLELFYRLGRAGRALDKLGAIDFATTIAPGVRDVLSVGKVYEAVRRRSTSSRSDGSEDADQWRYDAVVLDAPPTGRVVRFLGVGGEVGELAKVGPIRSQAEAMTRLLRSTACAIHVVTLLEEMPVQETADALAEIRQAQLRPGAVIVNQVRDAFLTAEDLAEALAGRLDRDALAADLHRCGLPDDPATVEALCDDTRAHAVRLELEDAQLEIVDALGLPVVLLPVLPEGTDPDSVRVLAAELLDQREW